MTCQTIGVVYDAATKQILSCVDPDHDWELDDPAHTPPGAVMVRLDRAGYTDAAGVTNVDRVFADVMAGLA